MPLGMAVPYVSLLDGSTDRQAKYLKYLMDYYEILNRYLWSPTEELLCLILVISLNSNDYGDHLTFLLAHQVFLFCPMTQIPAKIMTFPSVSAALSIEYKLENAMLTC